MFNCPIDSLTFQKVIILRITNFNFQRVENNKKKAKGKAVPLQAWSGPEGSRNLRFPYYMKTAQDGGKVVSITHRPPLPPGNAPSTYFC